VSLASVPVLEQEGSIVLCESKERERHGRRIVLLPRHMRSLLDSFSEERRKMREEIDQLKEENEKLLQVNDQLMKNIEDNTLLENARPRKPLGYSAVFDEAAPKLTGLPLPGGLPGSGKK
jgi:predicted  nucleic acid-binding Zn-ribbon protein